MPGWVGPASTIQGSWVGLAERRCISCDHSMRSHAILLCPRCLVELRRRLAFQSWARTELLVEFRRQSVKQARQRAAGLMAPLLFDVRAAELLDRQSSWLAYFTAELVKLRRTAPAPVGPVCTSCGHGSCRKLSASRPQDGSVPQMAAYLTANLSVLKRHQVGGGLLGRLRSLDEKIMQLVDLPEMRTRIRVPGPCPNLADEVPCGGRVTAFVPADPRQFAYMMCDTCHAKWWSWEWRRAGAAIMARQRQLELQAVLTQQIARGKSVDRPQVARDTGRGRGDQRFTLDHLPVDYRGAADSHRQPADAGHRG